MDAALLIDWENLKFSLLQRSIRPNVSALRDAAERFGRVVVARAYADWQDGYHTRDPANLYAAGIEPIYVPTRSYREEDSTEKRKNSVDVKLTADCIELCHNYPSINVYVLVTGDQDFLHVVNTLRPYGKRVIIVGVSWTTSQRLGERVDNVIYYDRDVDPIAEPAPVIEDTPAAVDPALQEHEQHIAWAAAEVLRNSPLAEDLVPELERLLEAIVGIVVEYRGRGQPLPLSNLGMELSKRTNQQIFSMVVKGRLKQITTALQAQGLIRVSTQGLADWLYLPTETPPAVDTQDEVPYGHQAANSQRFVDLPNGQRREVLAAIASLRQQPGISYLTFNKICDATAVTEAGRARGGDTRPLIQGMYESGVLIHDHEEIGFDPTTGNQYSFWAFRIDSDHEFARDCN